MTAPSLDITIEPAEANSVVYGVMAGKTLNDSPNGQLSLLLSIKNKELIDLNLAQVVVSFVGPPNVPASTITISPSFLLPKSATTLWFFRTAQDIILPVPAPSAVEVALTCDTFTDPVTATMPLVSYDDTAAGGGYAVPFKVSDLKSGEFWCGVSASHGDAGGGTQLFAYDLLVQSFDPTTNGWGTSPAAADKSLNTSYFTWGKPIYAIADGQVVQFLDGMAANTPPNFPNPTPSVVEGNHFYIQHGADLVVYAHLQAGTLNPLLTSGPNPGGTGASVTKGQPLGLAGNSGRSSEPHLHIHVLRATKPWQGPPRPLPFNDINVLDLTLVDPNTWPPTADVPWNPVTAQDLPNVLSAIWPGQLSTNWWIWLGPLTWAWIIIIGGLILTPGGLDCTKCGPLFNQLLGIVSIGLGIAGLVSMGIARRFGTAQRIAPRRIEMHRHFD
jgi:hypothetical protein